MKKNDQITYLLNRYARIFWVGAIAFSTMTLSHTANGSYSLSTVNSSKQTSWNALQTSQQNLSPWFFETNIGYNVLSIDSTMSVNNGSNFAPPNDVDTYTTHSKNHLTYDIGYGYAWRHDRNWFANTSLALHYQHLFSTNLGDQIMQYSLPAFTNYRYQWNISSDIVAATAKFDIYRFNKWSPYFTAGVGAAINRAEDFREYPYDGVIPRDTPAFGDTATTELMYSLGLGCDYFWRKNLTVHVGYEMEHLGHIASGNGITSWQGEKLNSNTLKARALMLGFTDFIE